MQGYFTALNLPPPQKITHTENALIQMIPDILENRKTRESLKLRKVQL